MGILDDQLDATITRINDAKFYAIATDAHGQTYFCFGTRFETMGRWDFEDLVVGSKVRLTPVGKPGGGFNGVDVRIMAI